MIATIATALVFSTWLVVTVITQLAAFHPRRLRWATWLKQHDAFAAIPSWTFFAPNPATTDTRVLWREQRMDGSVSPWHEIVPPPSGARRAVWNPRKRARKAVTDCGPMIHRLVRCDKRTVLPVLSLPYLMLLQHISGLPDSDLSVARQFSVFATQGADTEDDGFRVLLVSHWHRQPKVAPEAPLLAPLLPEIPFLAKRQGEPVEAGRS